MDKLLPVHPGEVLLEDFIRPLGLNQYRVAASIRRDQRLQNQIGRGSILLIDPADHPA